MVIFPKFPGEILKTNRNHHPVSVSVKCMVTNSESIKPLLLAYESPFSFLLFRFLPRRPFHESESHEINTKSWSEAHTLVEPASAIGCKRLATSLSPHNFHYKSTQNYVFTTSRHIWQFLVGETHKEVESLSDCPFVVDKIVKHANCQHANMPDVVLQGLRPISKMDRPFVCSNFCWVKH